MKPNDKSSPPEEVLPTWDVAPPPAPVAPPEEAVPAAETDSTAPVAEPVGQAFQPDREPESQPDREPESQPDMQPESQPDMQPESQAGKPDLLESAPPAIPEEPAAAAPLLCPICGTARKGEEQSCRDCGYYFSEADLAQRPVAAAAEGTNSGGSGVPPVRLKDRFEVHERISERGSVTRYRGLDHGDGSGQAVNVVIVRQAKDKSATPVAEALPAAEPLPVAENGGEALPDFDELLPTAVPDTKTFPELSGWPSLAWEQALLTALEHPGLPAVVDRFQEGDFEYLIEEVPVGQSLWEAWDDPEADAATRFGYLAQIAEMLHRLHHFDAILEGIRPALIVIAEGQARLTDLGDLLPLPLPPDVPLRRTLYTAPEVLEGKADPRADLYSFGALLYALHVSRDVNEIDFDRSGALKPFIPRYPDIHPAFGRLMTKTFRKDVDGRFPSDEAAKEDATGFTELIRTLRTLGRTLDNVRLEIAAWTTTGMVRTGNEDAFALLHACESRQDDLSETALLLLCDGMGGYEAGEVAAAMAIRIMREYLVQKPPFAPLSGASSFPGEEISMSSRPENEGNAAPPIDVEEMKKLLRAALKEANRNIYVHSRMPGSKRRGMGCTAEAVYVDGRNIVVGHVGDSRAYHLHEGRLIQMTRDQTLVNRLVELGTLTAEEAETHPRRNELQQAIGGQPDVEPGLYHGVLKAGDWIVVCSDGLTNHVTNDDLEQMLRGEGYSAETVARRLVNLANLQGATDNATVVVIRAT